MPYNFAFAFLEREQYGKPREKDAMAKTGANLPAPPDSQNLNSIKK